MKFELNNALRMRHIQIFANFCYIYSPPHPHPPPLASYNMIVTCVDSTDDSTDDLSDDSIIAYISFRENHECRGSKGRTTDTTILVNPMYRGRGQSTSSLPGGQSIRPRYKQRTPFASDLHPIPIYIVICSLY